MVTMVEWSIVMIVNGTCIMCNVLVNDGEERWSFVSERLADGD